MSLILTNNFNIISINSILYKVIKLQKLTLSEYAILKNLPRFSSQQLKFILQRKGLSCLEINLIFSFLTRCYSDLSSIFSFYAKEDSKKVCSSNVINLIKLLVEFDICTLHIVGKARLTDSIVPIWSSAGFLHLFFVKDLNLVFSDPFLSKSRVLNNKLSFFLMLLITFFCFEDHFV